MAADLAYLPNVFKVDGHTVEIEDRSIVQPADTGDDFPIQRESFPRKIFTATWPKSQVETVERFFQVNGRHRAFLIFAPRDLDHKATDQALRNTVTGLGVGDGSTPTFQLQLSVSNGVASAVWWVRHPKATTVVIKVNSVTKTETTHYTIDYTTGVVTFTAGNEPANGLAVTGTFDYYRAVRFRSESLSTRVRQAFTANLFHEVERLELVDAPGQ